MGVQLMGIFDWGAKNWRGMDGEDEMSEEDWKRRGYEQTSAMFAGRDWKDSNQDSDGDNTAGCYNDDYSKEYQDQLNEKLDHDEYYEASVEQPTRSLWDWFTGG